MILPRIDDAGKPYVSYSQISLWNEAKGFNTGKPGREEFIRSYFLGETFEEKGGFATFGTEVENYITARKDADKFTEAEKQTLEQIKPFGVFQKEIRLDFADFYLKGYIDDITPDLTHIRDYKTASLNSSKKYHEDDYWQLDVYALAIEQECKVLPKHMEVCVIERLGNGFRGGRDVMSVGKTIWYIARQTNADRLQTLKNTIVATAQQISEYYQVFLKINK